MAKFRRERRLLLTGLALALAGPAGAQPQESTGLRLGVVPYMPVRRLLSLYQPIADLAGQVLAQPIRIFSAPTSSASSRRRGAASSTWSAFRPTSQGSCSASTDSCLWRAQRRRRSR